MRRSVSSILGSKDPDGTENVRKIAQKCKSSGQRFVDTDFPAVDNSIWRDPNDKGNFLLGVNIEWKRPEDIGIRGAEWSVFKSGIQADDMMQGAVGDCYFLAALSSVAEHPELIDSLIVEDFYQQGVYGVKFYHKGRWETVIIDDFFPCTLDAETNQYLPIFCRYNPKVESSKEIWMMLAEKAWAKLHGSYQIIGNGNTADTLCYLTGGHKLQFYLTEQKVWWSMRHGFLWKKLYRMYQNSTLESCVFMSSSGVRDDDQPLEEGALNDPKDHSGLEGDHAYSILKLVEAPHPKKAGETIQLINVCNPWGTYEWKGDYGDDSPLWTSALKKACGFKKADDGAFWMTFDDFCDYFTFIGCCVTHGKEYTRQTTNIVWKGGVNAGGRDDDTFRYNPTYVLKNTHPEVVLQLEQAEIRDCPPVDMYYWDLFVNVMKRDPSRNYADVADTVTGFSDSMDKDDPEMEPIPFRAHCCERITALEMYLEPGEYLITTTLFHAGFEAEAVMTVDSPSSFDLTPLQTPAPTAEARKKMATEVTYKGEPKCSISGVKINTKAPETFRVKKGVFWDLSKSRNYRCARCYRPFDASLPFFDIGKHMDGHWCGYCETCFKKSFYPKCVACDMAIFETPSCLSCKGTFVRVDGGRVHESCYVRYKLTHSTSNVVCMLPPKLTAPELKDKNIIPLVVTVINTPENIKGLRSFVDGNK